MGSMRYVQRPRYVLKGNVSQLEGIVKWTEIRLSNHLDALDSIGKAHDRFVVGDRCGFNEARASQELIISAVLWRNSSDPDVRG